MHFSFLCVKDCIEPCAFLPSEKDVSKNTYRTSEYKAGDCVLRDDIQQVDVERHRKAAAHLGYNATCCYFTGILRAGEHVSRGLLHLSHAVWLLPDNYMLYIYN